ncbi:MAG: hypothetical protein ACOC93_04095, partial [Planctomycetota bacterium]
MTQQPDAPSQPSPPVQPKRRWWQRALRVVVVVALLLGAAYVTLPWWLPGQWLARRAAADLSEQAGVDVIVGDVSLSWSEGVRLRDVRFASPAGFHSQPLLAIDQLRTEFAPATFLLGGQLEWVEVDRPHLWVRVDEQGNTNLAPLGRLSDDVTAERVSVHRAVVSAHVPRSPEPVTLRISDLQLTAGRATQIGRVTLSGRLDQEGETAPVAVRAQAGQPDSDSLASASLVFSGVDLGQLYLPELLGLPLRELGGTLRGKLQIETNRQAVVETLRLDVRVDRLDAQPAVGPDLPVIEQAGLALIAQVDPLTDRLLIRSATLRLPGLNLAGEAEIDIGGGLAWSAVQQLALRGQIEPLRLAGLLTGRGELAGGLRVEGPVELAVSGVSEQRELRFELATDATEATFTRKQRTLKPAGRASHLRLAGRLDQQTHRLALEELSVRLGENLLTGKLAVQDVGELLPLPRRAMDWLAVLGETQLQGRFADLPALVSLDPALADLFAPVQTQGPILVRAGVEPGAEPVAAAAIEVPAETMLRIPGWFGKESGGAPLSLRVTVRQRRAADKLHAKLVRGDAALSVRGEVDLARRSAKGSYAAEDVDFLLGGVRRAQPVREAMHGDVQGAFDLSWANRQRRLGVTADLSELTVVLGRWLDKPAGRPGSVRLELTERSDASAWRAEFAAAVPSVRAEVAADLPEEWTNWKQARRGELAVRLTDAEQLLALLPGVRQRLRGQIRGQAHLAAQMARQDGAYQWRLELDGDGLEVLLPGPTPRHKPASAALGLNVRGRTRPTASGTVAGELSGDVRLGESRLALRADGAIHPWMLLTGREVNWSGGSRLTIATDGTIHLPGALGSVVPELAGVVERHGLAGVVGFGARLARSEEGVHLTASLDADDLRAGRLSPGLPVPGGGPALRLRKPADVPASARVDLHVGSDGARLKIRELAARLGTIELTGSAQVRLGQGALPENVRPERASLRLASTDLASLTTIAPGLERYQPSGTAALSADWSLAKRLNAS